VFSHTTINRNCKSCGELLAERSGSKANIIGKVLEVLDQ
jgi:ribosomal protein S27E